MGFCGIGFILHFERVRMNSCQWNCYSLSVNTVECSRINKENALKPRLIKSKVLINLLEDHRHTNLELSFQLPKHALLLRLDINESWIITKSRFGFPNKGSFAKIKTTFPIDLLDDRFIVEQNGQERKTEFCKQEHTIQQMHNVLLKVQKAHFN